MKQLRLIIKIITRPREAFRELPSNKWYVLAWLAPLYTGAVRAFRPPNYERNIEAFGSNWNLLGFVLVVGIIMVPLSAWIMRQILKLFGKRLSVRKLANICGYALVPRLIVAVTGYILLFLWPLRTPEKGVIEPQILIMMTLGGIGIIYTIILYVFGIVVSESETETE